MSKQVNLKIDTNRSSEIRKRSGTIDQPIGFWKVSEKPYGCMSQWFIENITFKSSLIHDDLLNDLNILLTSIKTSINLSEIENFTFNCTEQFMMMGKVLLFDSKMKNELMKIIKPNKIKEFGRWKIEGFDENVWQTVNVIWVAIGNYMKFSQNNKLKKLLIGTKDIFIVEASPMDKIWGIGLSPDNYNLRNPSRWKGENRLGEAIMIVRNLLT